MLTRLRDCRLLLLATGVLCAQLLGACAAPASSSAMTVRAGDLQSLTAARLPRAGSLALVVTDVSGGMATNPMATPEISAVHFATALSQSLSLVGLTGDSDMERLQVHVQLLNVVHPPGDQDMPTYLTARYRIYPALGGDAIFDRTLRTGHMVPMRATPSLQGRQRAALEGAARKNIALFIGDVSEFGPDGG